MKSNHRIFSFSFVLSFFLLSLIFVSPVLAQTTAWASMNPKCVGPTADTNDVATIQGVECLVGNILAVAMTFIGIAAFVMFLVGSFQYMTSGANVKGTENGKNSFTFAILGIVVALASFLILRLLAQFTGVPDLLKFNTQVVTP